MLVTIGIMQALSPNYFLNGKFNSSGVHSRTPQKLIYAAESNADKNKP